MQEFDKDSDGHLEPKELAAALRSRNVIITDEQAQMFIDGEFKELHSFERERVKAGSRAVM